MKRLKYIIISLFFLFLFTLSITAYASDKSLTIKYMRNYSKTDKTVIQTKTYTKLNKFPNVTRKGYVFIGWSTKPNAEAKYKSGNEISTKIIKKLSKKHHGKIKLYAIWRNYVTIKFDLNGGTGTFSTSPKVYKLNSKLKGTINKTGYQFAGWALDKNSTICKYKINQKINSKFIKTNKKNITLYAVWITSEKSTNQKESTETKNKEENKKIIENNKEAEEKKEEIENNTSINAEQQKKYTEVRPTENKSTNAQIAANKNKFDIQCFLGPDAKSLSNESVAKDLAESGFTITSTREQYNPTYNVWYTKYLENAVKALEKYNIKTYIFAGHFQDAIYHSDEKIKEYLSLKNTKDAFRKIFSYKNVLGIDLCDEPDISQLNKYIQFAAKLRNGDYGDEYKVKEFYINLFPNAVNPQLLTNRNTFYTNNSNGTEIVYNKNNLKNYLDNYVDILANSRVGFKTLSADFYPELKNFNTTKRDYYYTHLSDIKKKAENNRMLPMNILTLASNTINTSKPSHITYQVNTALAFGMKRISYFTYVHPSALNDGCHHDWIGSVVDATYNKTNIFDVVRGINAWAFRLGNLLFDYNLINVEELNGNVYIGNKKEYTNTLGNIQTKDEILISEFTNSTLNRHKIIMLTNESADNLAEINFQPEILEKMYCYCPASNKWIRLNKNIKVYDSTQFMFSADTDGKITINKGNAIILAEN